MHIQKSRFLPLSVIKDELDGKKGNTDSTLEVGTEATPDPVDPTLSVSPEAERELHPIDRIPEVAGVPISLVRKLADCSIIKLVKSPAGRDLVRGSDLRLIRACNELARFGIEPKNLRQYLTAANREIPMFEQALASLSRHQGETPDERRLRREVALDRMLTLTGVVRCSIMRRELIDD